MSFGCWITVIVGVVLGLIIRPPFLYAQSVTLPQPGIMVQRSPDFTPTLIRGMTFYPDKPLTFDFILDAGDQQLSEDALEKEVLKVTKYFLTSLAIPEGDMWVNLSPYEENRIIPDDFSRTEMGQDLLAQDYILKQIMASLIYPENELGKAFWDKIYQKAYEVYGVTEIPISTYNKVWIVPEHATVFVDDKTVYVMNSHLKVMLEEDYLALDRNVEDNVIKDVKSSQISNLSSRIIKELILPELEKEVNEGRHFASLRQAYSAMILATWYKQNLHKSILGLQYVNQRKLDGINAADKDFKKEVYNQYLEAFRVGVFNFVKEDYDPVEDRLVPRKYYSGGIVAVDKVSEEMPGSRQRQTLRARSHIRATIEFGKLLSDAAMTASTFTSNYTLDHIERTITEALKDNDATEDMLANMKTFFLFNLGANDELKRTEMEQAPVVTVISDGQMRIAFQTPLREITVLIDTATKEVKVEAKVHWEALGSDSPDKNHQSFNNVSLRKSEFLYSAWKNGLFLTGFVSKWLRASFDRSHQFFVSADTQRLVLDQENTQINTPVSLLHVTLPKTKVQPPADFEVSKYQSVYVLIENFRGDMGFVRELVPAVWDKEGLHVLVNGFQGKVSIRDVFSFSGMTPQTWNKDFTPSIESPHFGRQQTEVLDNSGKDVLHDEIIVAGPMIRGSSVAERVLRYKLGIQSAYTEMVSIGTLYVPDGEDLFGTYANLDWLDGFARMKLSEHEAQTALQVVGPHFVHDPDMFDYQFTDEEAIVRTYVRAAHLAHKVGFPEFNINMCCPAQTYTQLFGGAGMLNKPELVQAIITAIRREVPGLRVSAKIVLPSMEGRLEEVDEEKLMHIAEQFESFGLSRLIIQAETLAFDTVRPDLVKTLAQRVQMPITYNGHVIAVKDEDKLAMVGNTPEQSEYYSVEELIEFFRGTAVDRIMVARSVLGSPWLFTGETYTDDEIIHIAYRQARYMAGAYYGMANSGLVSMKIGLFHYIKHVQAPDRRNQLEAQISQAKTQEEIIAILGKDFPGGNPGGIDLSSRTLKLDVQGSGIDLKLNMIPMQHNDLQIEGLYPIILNISPLGNLPLLLSEHTDITPDEKLIAQYRREITQDVDTLITK